MALISRILFIFASTFSNEGLGSLGNRRPPPGESCFTAFSCVFYGTSFSVLQHYMSLLPHFQIE